MNSKNNLIMIFFFGQVFNEKMSFKKNNISLL